MRNILRLFVEDLRSLQSNLVAALVVMGLLLTPALYAWFNTLGFWDPYSATGNIEVAVANADEGYESDLLPTRVNAGEEIVSQLRANDQFKWVFTTEEDAVNGVRSGSYYAALVIPKDFTAKLFTLFSPHISTADIVYYTNQRENAVAPRVTTEGANELETQIDQAFTKTVSSVALETSSNLMNFMNGDGIASYGHTLDLRLTNAIDLMNDAATETTAFSSLLSSTASLARAQASIMSEAGAISDQAIPLLNEVDGGLGSGIASLEQASNLANAALPHLDENLTAMNAMIDEELNRLSGAPGEAEAILGAIVNEIGRLISMYEEARALLDDTDPTSPLIAALDQTIQRLQGIQAELDQASSAIQSGSMSIDEARERIQTALDEAQASIHDLQDGYEQQLYDEGSQLLETMRSLHATAGTLSQHIDEATTAMASSSDSFASRLDQAQGALVQTAAMLSESSGKLAQIQTELQRALAAGNLDELRRIIGSDPSRIADLIAAPTELDRQAVYPVANNGSAMSPFYTALSIWIGSIFMIALMETVVGKRRLNTLTNPRQSELYLGRYLIFLLFSLCQASLVCLGNLWFLGIQCEHPLLYLISVWVTALVFSNIVYTLTISFGKVGESIAVILLVLQVAGSGGIFPVVMSADLFQVIYPFLPFTHAMAAFQSCVAGIYDGQFWVSLGLLLLFLVPMLILGLLLRKPVIRLNEILVAKMEETKLL